MDNYNTSMNNDNDDHVVSTLTTNDFELLWKWLQSKNNKKNKKGNIKMVYTYELRKIFSVLRIFDCDDDVVDFMFTWGCLDEDTVTPEELKRGLTLLSHSQFSKFYRFVIALQKKDRLEKDKKEEQEKLIQREMKRKEQIMKNKEKRMIKQQLSQSFGKRIKPVNHSTDQGDNNKVIPSTSIERFKQRHGLLKKKSNSYGARFIQFLRSLSRRGSSDSAVSPMSSEGPQVSVSRSFSFSDFSMKSSDSAMDILSFSGSGILCDDISDSGHESLSHYSILSDKICGNEAMNSYRIVKQPSEISDSLVSFDSHISCHSSLSNEIMN